MTPRSSDEILTCPCCGASRAVRIQSVRYLSHIAGDAYWVELHRIVNKGRSSVSSCRA